MFSRRFVPVFPVGVGLWLWVWLILVACVGLSTQFSCKTCSSEADCKSPKDEPCQPPPPTTDLKQGCSTHFKDGKLTGASCASSSPPVSDFCRPSGNTSKRCQCYSDMCNKDKFGGGGGSKNKLPWNNLLLTLTGLVTFLHIRFR